MGRSEDRSWIIDRILEQASRQLEIRAALISAAPDPIAMVGWLKPIIANPQFDGGAVPEMYYRIAEFELQLRKKKGQETLGSVNFN